MAGRKILLPADMDGWRQSEAYHRVISFVQRVNEAIGGMTLSQSPACQSADRIVRTVEFMRGIIDGNPAVPMNQRYGNPAFRGYYAQLSGGLRDFVGGALSVEGSTQDELTSYLLASVGNPVRIDYGTGHELAFVGFLAALDAHSPFTATELQAVGLVVFPAYLALVRTLQKVYSLEPAGSHGVWGLDDYQFLPFLWGSAQLVDSAIAPSAITDPAAVQAHADEYMYFQAIAHITGIKRGRHFGEHSPVLYDISAVPSWGKINGGLVKMWQEEVLHKFPVVQHFLFGVLLRWNP